jgi:hypothetical protein
MQQQQKHMQALQQQQDLEMLLLQQQQQRGFTDAGDGGFSALAGLPGSGGLVYNKGGPGRDRLAGKRGQARSSLLGQSNRQGQGVHPGAAAAYADGLGLPSVNTGAARGGRQAGSSSSNRPAQQPHPGAYVPPQHLPGTGSPSSDAANSGGNARDAAAAAAALDGALAAAAAAAMPASQELLQQHQSALLAAAAAAQAGSNQRQQQQQSKASRACRGRNDDPDASMSSAPTSDSAMDDDADDDADDDDEAARRSSSDDAAAVPAGPMSRRALLGLPPVGLGHRHKHLLAGQAGMRLQIVKPQPPKNHVSAQRARDSSFAGFAGILQHIWVNLWYACRKCAGVQHLSSVDGCSNRPAGTHGFMQCRFVLCRECISS